MPVHLDPKSSPISLFNLHQSAEVGYSKQSLPQDSLAPCRADDSKMDKFWKAVNWPWEKLKAGFRWIWWAITCCPSKTQLAQSLIDKPKDFAKSFKEDAVNKADQMVDAAFDAPMECFDLIARNMGKFKTFLANLNDKTRKEIFGQTGFKDAAFVAQLRDVDSVQRKAFNEAMRPPLRNMVEYLFTQMPDISKEIAIQIEGASKKSTDDQKLVIKFYEKILPKTLEEMMGDKERFTRVVDTVTDAVIAEGIKMDPANMQAILMSFLRCDFNAAFIAGPLKEIIEKCPQEFQAELNKFITFDTSENQMLRQLHNPNLTHTLGLKPQFSLNYMPILQMVAKDGALKNFLLPVISKFQETFDDNLSPLYKKICTKLISSLENRVKEKYLSDNFDKILKSMKECYDAYHGKKAKKLETDED